MELERVNFSSSAVELSESKTYIDVLQRLCFYGEPNYNSVMLPVEDAEERAQTLVNQPVVAKYTTTAGKPDLGGHECTRMRDGSVSFGTAAIGTHTSVFVKEDTVNIDGVAKTLPCLFANMRIWTRNHNIVSAIKRLFNENRLHSSWELLVSDYEFKDGIKVLKDYVFEANALLGTNNPPAYGEAAIALSLAESETAPETIIAEALAMDLIESEGRDMEDIKKETENTSDIEQSKTCNPDDEKNKYKSAEEEEKEEESAVESELNARIAELTSDIAERDKALVSANIKITNLEAQLSELNKYKELYDGIMAERAAAELEATKDRMLSDVRKSKLFSEEEIASEEMTKLFEAGDEDGMKKVIAEKFIKSLEDKNDETETSEVEHKEDKLKADVSESTKIDNKKFMSMLLGN